MEQLDQGVFTIGEKVFVPHTDKYYEAKILKAEFRGARPPEQAAGWFYFLHYNGWNKKYDEWVEESGLVKAEVAEAAGAAQAAPVVKKKAGAANNKTGALGGVVTLGGGALLGRRGGPGAGGSSGALGGGTPGGLPGVGDVGGAPTLTSAPPVGLDIDMPPLLKKVLVEDYEAVVEGGRLVPVPRDPCVADVLGRYVGEARQLAGGGRSVDAEEEVAHGLQSYFDKALAACLLYRSEHDQAHQVLCDGALPSAVYGAEHLARLLVRLPDLLPLGTLGDDQLATMATMLQDVMMWMAENASSLFLPRDQYMFTGAVQGGAGDYGAPMGVAPSVVPVLATGAEINAGGGPVPMDM